MTINDQKKLSSQRWVARHLIAPALTAALLAAGLSGTANAEQSSQARNAHLIEFADQSTRLNADQLSEYRGGFTGPDGFDFSFGMTTLQRVNDEPLVAQSLVQINDVISSLSRADMPTQTSMTDASRNVALQVGPNNVIQPGALSATTGATRTFIQNSLDNQVIRNATVYDLQLSQVGNITRSVNASVRRAALSHQLVDSIR